MWARSAELRWCDQRHVLDVVEVLALELAVLDQSRLELLDALVGEGGGALLLVDLEIALAEQRDQRVGHLVERGAVGGGAGDDQRGARLVDEDRVHFVDDGVFVAALHHLVAAVFHVVAQVVEAELVIGAVGDVGGVAGLALGVVEAVDDNAGGQCRGSGRSGPSRRGRGAPGSR